MSRSRKARGLDVAVAPSSTASPQSWLISSLSWQHPQDCVPPADSYMPGCCAKDGMMKADPGGYGTSNDIQCDRRRSIGCYENVKSELSMV